MAEHFRGLGPNSVPLCEKKEAAMSGQARRLLEGDLLWEIIFILTMSFALQMTEQMSEGFVCFKIYLPAYSIKRKTELNILMWCENKRNFPQASK